MASFTTHALQLSLLAGSVLISAQLQAAPTCSVHSAASVTPVVELYTSEGCNSCPPADKWLSQLKVDAPVVALAFHVDYWDRLGWKDRFASAAFTQRQTELQRSSGARFSYTPQVILNGVDRPDWPRASVTTPGAVASIDAQLTRDGSRVTATIRPSSATPARLAAYWAVTEQGHVSAVKAGENQGVTLAHDHVVREYRPVPAWSVRPEVPATFQFDLGGAADPAHPRQVNLVIVDAESGRPLQAVKLGC